MRYEHTFEVEPLENRQLLSVSFGSATESVRILGPAVASVTLSGGVRVSGTTAPPTQSMLTSIAVVFSVPVTVKPGALALQNATYGANVGSGDIRASYNASTRTATWTFPNLVGGSLTDRRYNAALKSSLVVDSAGRPLDSDGDGVPGDYRFKLSRLFGDTDGNGAITPADVFADLKAYRSMSGNSRYSAKFDFNSDGAISDFDLLAEENRYGLVLNEVGPSTSATAKHWGPDPVPKGRLIAAAVANPGIKTITIQAKRKQTDAW